MRKRKGDRNSKMEREIEIERWKTLENVRDTTIKMVVRRKRKLENLKPINIETIRMRIF